VSETVAVALISASSALGGVFLAQLFHWLMQKREQEERYRLALHGRCLAAHQEAYKWLMDLIEPLRAGMRDGAGDDERQRLNELGIAARAWWDANCLYLDPESRGKAVDFIEDARSVAEGSLPDGIDPIKRYRDALLAVEEGIGMKHIEIHQRGK
jgi:hypothetical protein